jgi:hypothetical protein
LPPNMRHTHASYQNPEPQTARFRGAAIRAVFDKRSTLCLRKMTPYVRTDANVVPAVVVTVM